MYVCVVVVHMYGLNACVCVSTTVAIATIEHTTIVMRQNNIQVAGLRRMHFW